MIRLVFFTLLLLTAVGLRAQNLVPNPSFEEYHQCPSAMGQFGSVKNWFNPSMGTPDYFNVCAGQPSPIGVPKNTKGYQWPRTGNAYAGLLTFENYYQDPWEGSKEYISVRLAQALTADTLYCVEFFVNKFNALPYATSRMALHFSHDSIFVQNGGYLPLTPHISHPDTVFITDTLNWTRISGEYVAQGGEQYIIIGNFFSDADTEILNVNLVGMNNVYYYIDDVTVSKCSNFGVGVNALVGNERQLLNAFPNPSTGNLTIDYAYEPGMAYRIGISDLAGRIVYKGMVSAGSRMINLSHLTDGAYLVQLSKNDRVVGHSKLILLK